MMKLNTSNPGKLAEFKRMFAAYGCELDVSSLDLKEIDADPISVVVHKATHAGEGVLIEDSSLEIEGAFVGVNVRWLLDHLAQLEGKKCTWRALLAYRKKGQVWVFEGSVNGTIVKAQGPGDFGFDPYFMPDGVYTTLAQSKPDAVNARAKAVKALMCGQPLEIYDLLKDWSGPWQHAD